MNPTQSTRRPKPQLATRPSSTLSTQHRRSLPEGRNARRTAKRPDPKIQTPNKRLPRSIRMAVPISGVQHKHHEIWIPIFASSATKSATCRNSIRSRSADRQRTRDFPRVTLAAARCLHPKMEPHGLHATEHLEPKSQILNRRLAAITRMATHTLSDRVDTR
jgi:hypothetical protein